MVKIGSVNIDTNIFLAPLAGCTDLAFRLIAREHGARFCFFEMVDANTFFHGTYRKTLMTLKTTSEDTPVAAQLLGSDAGMMVVAAKRLLDVVNVPFIDVNAACPARKVIRKKSGAYLLQDPAALGKIVKEMASSLPVPVTVKMRLGHTSKDTPHIVKVAERCETSGASALFVHGRTGADGYKGDIDYAAIRRIKDAVKVPVFGVGNIWTPEMAKRMFDETGCDGICVARGALGNPWLFKRIERYLETGDIIPEPGVETVKKILKRHLAYINDLKTVPGRSMVGYMRKVVMWYIRGFPNARRIREKVCSVKTYDGMLALVDTA
ncbi:MAG: tRNA dihydrouridine synthase DusB [Candidatus Omnitrophota bacterium]